MNTPASLRLQEETEKTGLDDTKNITPVYEADDNVGVGIVLNASGHKQELQRHFSLLSICSIGITTGNVWAALGGSIVRQPLSFIPHQNSGEVLIVISLSGHRALQWRRPGRYIRVYRCISLLLDDCSLYR